MTPADDVFRQETALAERTIPIKNHGDPLERLAVLAHEVNLPSVAEEAQTLRSRLAEGRFYVACVGQFKRGKSTLINALLGEAVLPVGVTPVTAVVTVIRYGTEKAARIKRTGEAWEAIEPNQLPAFVTEERNPENQKQIEAVEIFYPSPLLASGMCLVDTPGIGSVFAGNTRTTQAFIPHIDAALVVIGADPPLSGEELAMVEEIATKVQRLLFVLNKADRLSEEDCNEAVLFAERILSERLKKDGFPIFKVSALDHLYSGRATLEWVSFESALSELATGAGAVVLRTAEQRGVERLSARLKHHVDELIAALTRPIEESERRVRKLGLCVAEAEHAMTELSYLFQAEQDRIRRIMDREAEIFYRDAEVKASEQLKAVLDDNNGVNGSSLRDRMMEASRQIAESYVRPWLDEMKTKAEGMYLDATVRFIGHANSFLARLAASGVFPPGSLPSDLSEETAFRARSEFYFHYFMAYASSSPIVWVLDKLRTPGSARRSILNNATNYLHWLLYANTSRVVGDINQRILESRRQFEYQIRKRLQEVSVSAEQGLSLAKSTRQSGEITVRQELQRLNLLGEKLKTV